MSSIREILEGLAEDYYPEHEYGNTWRDRNKQGLDEAEAQLNTYVDERVREGLSILLKGNTIKGGQMLPPGQEYYWIPSKELSEHLKKIFGGEK